MWGDMSVGRYECGEGRCEWEIHHYNRLTGYNGLEKCPKSNMMIMMIMMVMIVMMVGV